LRQGYRAGEKVFRVQIDGLNMLPYLLGEAAESPRETFFYVNDDGALVAIRHGDWKLVFEEQRAKTLQLWAEPFVKLRIPKMFNLRRDPFERADENSNTYYDWLIDHAFLLYGAQALVQQQVQSFLEFPPRQKPASFNLDSVFQQLQDAASGGLH
jgi:arylsulfatase A-like enzyme